MLVSTKEKNYCKLTENIRMMKNQRGDTEKKLIKNSKNVGIHRIIKQTGKINSKLKSLV